MTCKEIRLNCGVPILDFLGADPDKAASRVPADYNSWARMEKLPLTEKVRSHLAQFFKKELKTCAARLGGPARDWPARYGFSLLLFVWDLLDDSIDLFFWCDWICCRHCSAAPSRTSRCMTRLRSSQHPRPDAASPSGQPCFCQIEVALNSAQRVIINHSFVSQADNGFAFDAQRLVLQTLILWCGDFAPAIIGIFSAKFAIALCARRIRRATDLPRPEKTSHLRLLPRSI